MVGGLVARSGQRIDNLSLPVVLDQNLKILAISRAWVGDVVVGEPAFELSLMPLVVSCCWSQSCFIRNLRDFLPVLPNQELAVAVVAKAVMRRLVNLILKIASRRIGSQVLNEKGRKMVEME